MSNTKLNKDFLVAQIQDGMRVHDKGRVSILRQVKNEIDTKEKNERITVTDEQVVDAFKKVLKQTRETLEFSKTADAGGEPSERTCTLSQQARILEFYLPTQIGGDELVAIIDQVLVETGATEKRDMGKVIGAVVSKTGGAVDKAEVARLVQGKLV